jgi:type I restriction-modification system DNA methylase subunit
MIKFEEIKEEKTTKRKKDGVYYTPEEITTYICENTIILYLSKNNSNDLNNLLKEYKDNIIELEDKLTNIKIVDPACGSGAFLNKTIDILLDIHKSIHKIKYTNKSDDLNPYFDSIEHRKNILLNNIYGVDKNKESIEITKLSLFLKIAKKENKLPNLDKNIKCGNSLINNPEYTDNPFDWEDEFKEVFNNGGFDVVIGNPPYVAADNQNEEYQKQREYLRNSKDYETLYERWDLFIAFIEKGLKILRKNGFLSFIISNSYNTSKSAIKSKEFILENYWLKQIDFFKNINVFKGVGVESVILTINNSINNTPTKRILHKNEFNNIKILENTTDSGLIFRIDLSINFKKCFNNTELLGDICYIGYGLRPNADEKRYKGEFKKEDVISDVKTDIFKKQYLEGKNIRRYVIEKIRYLEWDTDRVPNKITRKTFNEL